MTVGEFFARFWDMLVGRLEGPLTLRFFLQPTVAAFFAIRAAMGDARAGRPPDFLWAVLTDPVRRPELLRLLWKDVGKVFIIATVLDVIYELIVYRWVYPLQALIVATALAIIPYLLIRGPLARILSRHR